MSVQTLRIPTERHVIQFRPPVHFSRGFFELPTIQLKFRFIEPVSSGIQTWFLIRFRVGRRVAEPCGILLYSIGDKGPGGIENLLTRVESCLAWYDFAIKNEERDPGQRRKDFR